MDMIPHALTREQVELLIQQIDRHSVGSALRFTLREAFTQQAQEVERLTKEVDKYKALLLQSCRDNIEDYKVQCKPKCDSYAHEPDCPATHPGLVYDDMRQQLSASQARCESLEEELASCKKSGSQS